MKDGKKVGITAGAFDLCHAGHMLMFEEAKSVCDYLIVALHTDPTIDRPQKNRPIMSVEERMIILKGVRWIDEIVTYDTEADLLKILGENTTIDIRILGVEYKDKPYTGRNLPIPTYYNTRGHSYSSTELRRRVYEAERKLQG